MPTPTQLWDLASHIDSERARVLVGRFSGLLGADSAGPAVLLGTAYPAMVAAIEADPASIGRATASSELGPTLKEGADLARELRLFARREKMRIALAELLPSELGGIGVMIAAAELTALAQTTIAIALDEARSYVFARFGKPVHQGRDGQLVVLGMGKLGGDELNAGSDVDLCCFYDTDDCQVVAASGQVRDLSAHAIWSRVVKRMTATLEEVTEDGFVWRVDLRLRPEGTKGPLVNSFAAAERYYESFGRLWERAALLRSRPIAGDLALGASLLTALEPFIWRRRVDPAIADTMYELVRRARRPQRDLKLGPGGIREAEMFVQTLQLVWGGRDPRLRARPTLQASAALCAGGLLSSREADDLAAAYTALRRAEHAVQWASGVQTHEIPSGDDLERLARAVGAASASELTRSLEQHRERIAGLFQSLLPGVAPFASPWKAAVDELDRGDADAFAGALEQSGMPWAREAAHELFELARIPDSPLGASSRERHRELAVTVLGSIADSADPEQAARYLRRVLGRIRHREIYTKLLADDPASIRRLCTVLGASAFIGEAAAIRPELADLILFEAGAVTPHDARDEIAEALAIARATLSPEADEQERVESFVGALRRAKSRIAARVALADLAGMIDTRAATLVLSELADASLDAATRVALGVDGGGEVEGLTILALGKLGGRDIGYGSDLDVLFLYDSSQAGGSARGDELTRVTRRAQRIIGLVSMPHVDGRGYQLDTRLRPSGNQGLLVTSLDGFARYHDRSQRHAGERAATWERLTLLRARVAAGDRSLGERALAIAQRAAYEDDADLAAMAADVDRLRGRMERELAREKEGRHDLKFGRGGLMDIELGVQLLQLAHGRDPRARTTDTAQAIEALAGIGAVDRWQHEALREGYTFLRKLEQRLRVVHDDDAHLIEESAAGLPKLARRMGIAAGDPAAELMAQYRSVTVRVRRCYQQIIEMR